MLKREELTALVRKAQSMDPDAMNTLFEECRDPIYYFALKTVQDADAAEDIAQEAMIDIFRNLEKLKDPAAFQAWSREITYRQCLHHMKKTPDVLVAEDEEGHSIFDTLEEENEDFIPDSAMENKDFQKTVQDMVNSLPAEQRSAILLYHFDGLSVKEIAQIQGVPENTVKSRLMYGRKAIKQAVETYEKKNGVKLHSFAIAPFLAWLLAKEVAATSMPAAASASTATGIATATGVTVAAGTTTAGVAVAATAAKASIPLLAKVAAGVAAIGVAVGGVAAAMGLFSDKGFNSPQYESAYMEIYGNSDKFQKEFKAVQGVDNAHYIQTKDDAVYAVTDPEVNLLEGCDVREVYSADNSLCYIDSEGTTYVFFEGRFLAFPGLKGRVVHSRNGLLGAFQVFSLDGKNVYSTMYNTEEDVLEEINVPTDVVGQETADEVRFSTCFHILDRGTVYYAASGGQQTLGSYTTAIPMDHTQSTPYTVDGEPVTVRYLADRNSGELSSPVFAVEGDERNIYTFSQYSAEAKEIWELPDNRKVSDLKQVVAASEIFLLFKDGTVYSRSYYSDEGFQKLDPLSKLGKQGHIERLYLSTDRQNKDLVCLMDDNVLYRYDPEGNEDLYKLLGTYKGTYEAKQGTTGLTLTVFREEGEYKATFHFYPLPGKDNSDEGKYLMTLRYDEQDGCYVLRGDEWLDKPGAYTFVNLTGKLKGNTLSGEEPTVFSVKKGP